MYAGIKKINDVNFIIQASPRGKPRVIHADRLTPCVGRTPADLGFGSDISNEGGLPPPPGNGKSGSAPGGSSSTGTQSGIHRN